MRIRPTVLLVLATVALVVIGAPALLAGGTGAWRAVEERVRQRPFDPAAWRASTPPDRAADDARLYMVEDLITSRALMGRTRAEVLALLGPARPTRYFRHYQLVYWVGPERRFLARDGLDYRWLAIHFDFDGRVSEVDVFVAEAGD